ncbi:MAG: hypothetical protein AB7U81_02165 [Thiohalomonadaceae bacterium]
MNGSEREIEELVLKESIVSATGLRPDSLQVGIKGDPSLRETAYLRKKYPNVMDDVFEKIVPRLADLLVNRGTYRIYIGFNSAEIRTTSIFDPLREETHAAEMFVDPAYVERHFPALPFDEKVQAMRDIYEGLMGSRMYARLPGYWRNIFEKRHASWKPMEPEQIPTILATLKVLRDMPDYYLRSATLCIVQDLIRMQFNCDGTQLVRAENYTTFLAENFGA